MAPKPLAPVVSSSGADQARHRIQLDVSPAVALLLDHICEVTGGTHTSLAREALLDALPALLERADALKKRHGELARAVPGKR